MPDAEMFIFNLLAPKSSFWFTQTSPEEEEGSVQQENIGLSWRSYIFFSLLCFHQSLPMVFKTFKLLSKLSVYFFYQVVEMIVSTLLQSIFFLKIISRQSISIIKTSIERLFSLFKICWPGTIKK